MKTYIISAGEKCYVKVLEKFIDNRGNYCCKIKFLPKGRIATAYEREILSE